MNHSDSERIAAFLEARNFEPASEIAKADLAIFNTCGVRQSAEDRVYGQIRNLATRNLKHETKKIIVLTGCLANRKDTQKRLKNKVDLFCEIKDFPKKIEKLLVTSYRLWVTPRKNSLNNYLSIMPKFSTKYSAFIPIMTGCNNFCSYCVVPCARGREISRPAEDILKEARLLIKKGYKEIILLGQNVNSYKSVIGNLKSVIGRKNPNCLPTGQAGLPRRQADKLPITNYKNINFSDLLKMINNIPGNFWISFISNHPKDMNDELIETIAKLKKVCECVHLPIQSGDDEILKKMNRKYTVKQYLKLVGKIRKAFAKHKPNVPCAITTDIIVGFPGETRKQFLGSAEIMKKVKYDMAYTAQYSPRPETAAWKIKDNVSRKEKGKREKILTEILKKTALENNKKYAGKVFEVLVEKEKNGFCFGKTRSLKNVRFQSPSPFKNLVGNFVKVKITKAAVWNLDGKINIK